MQFFFAGAIRVRSSVYIVSMYPVIEIYVTTNTGQVPDNQV